MKKTVALVSMLAVGAAANAAINLHINVQYQTVAAPSVGSIAVVYSGYVDVLLAGWDVSAATLELPSDGTNFLGVAWDPGFSAYVGGNNPGADYFGDLFSVTVNSNTTPGFYHLNAGNGNPFSQLIVSATQPGAVTVTDDEMFGLTVDPVPEPATLAALGLGAAAFIRRKRR